MHLNFYCFPPIVLLIREIGDISQTCAIIVSATLLISTFCCKILDNSICIASCWIPTAKCITVFVIVEAHKKYGGMGTLLVNKVC